MIVLCCQTCRSMFGEPTTRAGRKTVCPACGERLVAPVPAGHTLVNWLMSLPVAAMCLTALVSGCCLLETAFVTASHLLDREEFVSHDRTAEALSVLAHLNNWDREAMDLVECHDRHSEEEDKGEAGGWIWVHQEQLAGLGFSANWNREKKLFELHQR